MVDLTPLGFSSLLEVIEAGERGRQRIDAYVGGQAGTPLDQVRLLAPIPKPRKLLCVGLNYRDHAEETGQEIPKVPTIFNKFATAVIAHGDADRPAEGIDFAGLRGGVCLRHRQGRPARGR